MEMNMNDYGRSIIIFDLANCGQANMEKEFFLKSPTFSDVKISKKNTIDTILTIDNRNISDFCCITSSGNKIGKGQCRDHPEICREKNLLRCFGGLDDYSLENFPVIPEKKTELLHITVRELKTTSPRKPTIHVIGNPPARVSQRGYAFGVWSEGCVASAWIPLSKGIQRHGLDHNTFLCTKRSQGCPGCLTKCSSPAHSRWASFEVKRHHMGCGLFLDDYSEYYDSPPNEFEKSVISFNDTARISTTDSPENASRDVFAASFLAEWPNENDDRTAHKDDDLINFNKTLGIRTELTPSSNINEIFSSLLIASSMVICYRRR